MSQSESPSPDERDRFWSVVRGCLREFHSMSPDAARRRVARLRKQTEEAAEETREVFFHSEPFDVAAEITGVSLDLRPHLDRYLQIRDRQVDGQRDDQVVRRV